MNMYILAAPDPYEFFQSIFGLIFGHMTEIVARRSQQASRPCCLSGLKYPAVWPCFVAQALTGVEVPRVGKLGKQVRQRRVYGMTRRAPALLLLSLHLPVSLFSWTIAAPSLA